MGETPSAGGQGWQVVETINVRLTAEDDDAASEQAAEAVRSLGLAPAVADQIGAALVRAIRAGKRPSKEVDAGGRVCIRVMNPGPGRATFGRPVHSWGFFLVQRPAAAVAGVATRVLPAIDLYLYHEK